MISGAARHRQRTSNGAARRVTLLLRMRVHGLWNFSLISNSVGADPELSPAMILSVLWQVVLIVVLLARRRSIAPANGPTPVQPAPGA
ncbi:hypothetical protein [Streptomyces sp. NPDC048590]|uniref:hypothetical protein n=1 Tax=Streptomyces sp. NPDC048590 TaxID=3365574 RepID=UPI00371DC16D